MTSPAITKRSSPFSAPACRSPRGSAARVRRMKPIAGADLYAYLTREARLIDEALAAAVPPLGAPPPALHDAMRYTLLLPGKRLRGIVVVAACELLRGRREDALPLACAVEMVHTSSLILDDLPSMDNATLRRGKPTLHSVAGEANAVLAAVGLLNGAFATIQSAPAL